MVVLDECYVDISFFEFFGVVDFEEEVVGVFEDGWFDEYDVGKVGLDEVYGLFFCFFVILWMWFLR